MYSQLEDYTRDVLNNVLANHPTMGEGVSYRLTVEHLAKTLVGVWVRSAPTWLIVDKARQFESDIVYTFEEVGEVHPPMDSKGRLQKAMSYNAADLLNCLPCVEENSRKGLIDFNDEMINAMLYELWEI